jgi:DNA-directed RNA polymerase beta subunit
VARADPFLEHDDANRALMGSNMQRQGVPLIVSESPLVGTVSKGKVARDSHAVVVATDNGKVASVTAEQIVITRTAHAGEPQKLKSDHEAGVQVYELRQVHALERRHLREPEADREERPGSEEGPGRSLTVRTPSR